MTHIISIKRLSRKYAALNKVDDKNFYDFIGLYFYNSDCSYLKILYKFTFDKSYLLYANEISFSVALDSNFCIFCISHNIGDHFHNIPI